MAMRPVILNVHVEMILCMVSPAWVGGNAAVFVYLDGLSLESEDLMRAR